MWRCNTSHGIAMASTNTQDAQGKALSLQDALFLVSSTVGFCVFFVVELTSACSELQRHRRRHRGVIAHPRPFLLLSAHHRQVAEQRLTPGMANRACINPTITRSALSRHHQARDRARQGQVHRLLQKQKADAAGGVDSFPSNGATSEGGSGRRGRWKAAGGTANEVLFSRDV